MARYRSFLFPESSVEVGSLILDPRESHHLVRVFRAKVGETIEVLDGAGRRYIGSISKIDAKAVQVSVDSEEYAPIQTPRVTLLQSIPKGKTMDLILRMATEIGATDVQPIFTDQGDVQMKGERLVAKLEKWRLTMIESCKQCGLAYLPQLHKPLPLLDWLGDQSVEEPSLRIVASLEDGSRPLAEVLRQSSPINKVVVAVGPEGDFTAKEYAALSALNFRHVRLGNNILRAETAAAYILSVVDQFSK